MAVDNYKTIEKTSVDEAIEYAKESESIIALSLPIEHYSIDELKELADKLEKEDFIIIIKAEYSNFYQGVLIGIVRRENVTEKYSKYM